MLTLWLPLDGNIRNQGLNSGVTMTSGSTTSFDDNGVIGRCMICTGDTNGAIYDNNRSTELNYTDNFSWAVWVKSSYETGKTQYVFTVSRADASTWGYGLQPIATNQYYVRFGSKPYTVNVTANEWVHLAFSKQGTTIKIYKNGELYGTYTFDGTLPTYSTDYASGLGVGCFYYAAKSRIYPYYGKICDLRIYDNVLTDTDVKKLYQCKAYELTPPFKSAGSLRAVGDASGVGPLINHTITNASLSGNTIWFNGTTGSSITCPSFCPKSGGTLSVWFKCPKPGSAFLFCDPSAKMALSFYSNGTYIIPHAANGSSDKRYLTDGITWNKMNNVTTVYNTNGTVNQTYINGEPATQSGTDHWNNSEAGYDIAYIGKNNWNTLGYTGGINTIKVFQKQFTADEVKALYNEGPVENSLPSEYTELEYIQSSNGAYINTGIKACMNKIRCECDFVPTDTRDSAFFGARGTYFVFYNVNGNYFWPISKCEEISGTLAVGEKYHVDWNKGTLIAAGANNVFQKAVRSNNTQDTGDMYIFNFNPLDGSNRVATAKLYYFNISIEGVYVRKFVPAKRNSDNAIGLFDKVTGTFFGNANSSGSFIAGPLI